MAAQSYDSDREYYNNSYPSLDDSHHYEDTDFGRVPTDEELKKRLGSYNSTSKFVFINSLLTKIPKQSWYRNCKNTDATEMFKNISKCHTRADDLLSFKFMRDKPALCKHSTDADHDELRFRTDNLKTFDFAGETGCAEYRNLIPSDVENFYKNLITKASEHLTH